MKKLALAAIALFAFSEGSKLKNRCQNEGEGCIFNSQCCGDNVCLVGKGRVCGPHLAIGDKCSEDGECGSPNFCDSVCKVPYESGHECRFDSQCQSKSCKGNWYGTKKGKCK
jgi:hypothetical protein